jgi:hypothetical protein
MTALRRYYADLGLVAAKPKMGPRSLRPPISMKLDRRRVAIGDTGGGRHAARE